MARENPIEKGDKEPEDGHDVDRGFAWIVLAGCFCAYFFILGTMKSSGVLYTEMVEYFSSGSGSTAWIGSIAWLFLLSLGPVAGLLSKRFGFRNVTITGGVLVGTGYFLSGFVEKMELMYLTFTICGIGYGLSYFPCATIISFYFKKRRALANAIVVSSGGIGALSLPFLYKYLYFLVIYGQCLTCIINPTGMFQLNPIGSGRIFLIERYGLSGTFWILGAMVSNICVAGCAFRQPSSLLIEGGRTKVSEHRNRDEQDNSSISHTKSNKKSEEKRRHRHRCTCNDLGCKFALLKNPLFTMYVVAFTFAAYGDANNIILIPAHIKALGFDKTYVALGVSITGGFEAVSRIFIGWFADLKIVQTKYIFVVSMFIGGIFALITPLFKSFTYMAIYAAVVSAFPASFIVLMPILTIEVVGMENLPAGFGIIGVGMAFAALITQPISGWLADYYGSWNSGFILTGSAFILAGVSVLLEPAIARCKKTPKDIANDQGQMKKVIDPEETQTQEIVGETVISNISTGQHQSRQTHLPFIHETSATLSPRVMKKPEKQPVRLLWYKNRTENWTMQTNKITRQQFT